MVDFLTLTANWNVSRSDIFDFSDFFDFQADVPPEINDLRNPGFGLLFALSSSTGKRTGSRAWAHWKGEASCRVKFETRLANEALLPLLMPLRTRNSWPPPRMEMNWVLKVSPSVTSEGFLHSRFVTHEFGKMPKTLSRKLSEVRREILLLHMVNACCHQRSPDVAAQATLTARGAGR